MVLGIDLSHVFIQLLQKISLAAHLGRESQLSLIVLKSTHVMHNSKYGTWKRMD